MITVNKEKLIDLIKSFIAQGADDIIHLGNVNPEDYINEIKFQLKQIEIQLHDDLNQECCCDMCKFYNNSDNLEYLEKE